MIDTILLMVIVLILALQFGVDLYDRIKPILAQKRLQKLKNRSLQR